MAKNIHSPLFETGKITQDSVNNTCDWAGCYEEGLHRAPHSRDEPDKFRWFCKAHAAQYNKAWNFFAGMAEEEIEAIIRCDTVWNRPSWPIGTGPALNAFMRGSFIDPFSTFTSQEPPDQSTYDDPSSSTNDQDLQRALAVFGLENLGHELEIKRRYKELVKRHHPDANSAKDTSDDRIKEINHAYTVILNFLAT